MALAVFPLGGCGDPNVGEGLPLDGADARRVKAATDLGYEDALAAIASATGGDPTDGRPMRRLSCSESSNRDVNLKRGGWVVVHGRSVAEVRATVRTAARMEGWELAPFRDGEAVFEFGGSREHRLIGSALVTGYRDGASRPAVSVRVSVMSSCINVPTSLLRLEWP